jgi:hypothetical protein
MQTEQAAKILNEIIKADGVVPDSDWEQFVYTSRGLYVKVMRKLRDVGLVEKRMGEYRLVKDFSSALEKMAKYWADIVTGRYHSKKLQALVQRNFSFLEFDIFQCRDCFFALYL